MNESAMTSAPGPEPTARRRRYAFQLAAVALTLVSALAGTGLARWLRNPGVLPESEKPAAEAGVKFPGRLFLDWKTKPDLVLLVTAQQNGYLLPCGCSKPQYGGLERRYNFLELVKAAGWPYAAIDLGDIVQKQGIAHLPNMQGLLKYVASMKALKQMGYSAVSFGESEVQAGLFNVLAEYALNDPQPRVVVGNLIGANENFPDMTQPWIAVEPAQSGIKIGVTGIVGPTIAGKIKELTRGHKDFRFEQTSDALNRVLAEMQGKVDLRVLLYQGPVTRNAGKKPYTEAMACAEAYPQFPLVVCLSDEDEAPMRPVEVTTKAGTKSLIISLGKKGRFLGAVGIWKTGNPKQPYEFRYERVELGEEFLTPEDKEKSHPVIQLIEGYTRELKDKRYLEKYGQVKHELQALSKVEGLTRDVPVTYVGSEVCKRCHDHAYAIWKKTPHSHAYQTLVDATKPGNRQYDPECIVCHTVGFGYVSGFVTAEKTPLLKDVGCESCHGPSSVHVKNPNDVTWHKRINPWKYLPADKREAAIDDFCQKCHDIDNDVTWVNGGFKRKWPKVEHNNPTP